ncbi:MAG: alkaline phosphatase [Bacteroides sp.]|nr:alkaline phosphatase [Bacteroides sp.]
MFMERRTFLKRGLASLATMAVASALPPFIGAKKKKNDAKTVSRPGARRVLIIGLDGISVEGFETARTPNLDNLLSQGCLSLQTRVVMPSMTQPNWMSHLSGSGPEVHGVEKNSWRLDNHILPALVTDEEGYYPTLFKVLKDTIPGMKTAYYYNWDKLINPYNQKYLDVVSYEENDGYLENYAKALEFMRENRDAPSVVFLYSVHTDNTGHKYGWMTPEYIAALEEADENIGKLLKKMKEEGLYDDTHFMFITDHGGINKGHGGMTTNEMIVPWGITGPGIRKGLKMTEPNNTVNTATVILDLFGVEQPLYWTGEIPKSIYG